MKWIRLVGTARIQPPTGSYNDWKDQIAADCKQQCVYCAIPEARFGGSRNFHIDHFRPKSIQKYKKLENAIANLYYACAICNGFKGSAWPGEPCKKHSRPRFPDPATTDFNELLLTSNGFTVKSAKPSGRYLVERVFLNRPQLIHERRLAYFCGWANKVVKDLRHLQEALIRIAPSKRRDRMMTQMILILSRIVEQQGLLLLSRPYESEEIRRN